MSNPYQQQYLRPQAYHQQPYNTRAQQQMRQNQFQQSYGNNDVKSEYSMKQSPSNANSFQEESYSTPFTSIQTPQTCMNPLYENAPQNFVDAQTPTLSSGIFSNTIPQSNPLYEDTSNNAPSVQMQSNSTLSNQQYKSTLQQIEQLQSQLHTPQVQQNLQPKFDNAQSPMQDQIMQNLLQLCQSIVKKQNQNAQSFSNLETNANTLVKDISNAFIQTEMKIPNVEQLRYLFQEYTQMIGKEITSLVDLKQASLQEEMSQQDSQNQQSITQLNNDIDGIQKFQEQFNSQCNTFAKCITDLNQNYMFLQQRLTQYTPQQLSENKLSNKVYDQVLNRVSNRMKELLEQHKQMSRDQLYNEISGYINKELQRLQTDVSQSIKKQQVFEYNILKNDIIQQTQAEQQSIQSQQNAQNQSFNEQIQHISNQIAQMQLQRQQNSNTKVLERYNKYDDVISQQQLQLNLLKQQLVTLTSQSEQHQFQRPKYPPSTSKSEASLNHFCNNNDVPYSQAQQHHSYRYQQPLSYFSNPPQEQHTQQQPQQPWNENYRSTNMQYGPQYQYNSQMQMPNQSHMQMQQYGNFNQILPNIKIEKFKGNSNAELWISKLERQLQLRPDLNDHQATLIALDNLLDQPYRWAHTHAQYFAIYFDQFNSLNNVYSFQAFKQLFLKRFVKPLENFQEQLMLEKQMYNQSYDDFARRINIIACQGNVQESYLKLVFLNNMNRQDVALQLSHLRDDPKFDLLDLSREAHFVEQKLNYIKKMDRSRMYSDGKPSSFYSKGKNPNGKSNPKSFHKPSTSANPKPKPRNQAIQNISDNVDLNTQNMQDVIDNVDENVGDSQPIQFIDGNAIQGGNDQVNNDLDEDFDYDTYDDDEYIENNNNVGQQQVGALYNIGQEQNKQKSQAQTQMSQYEKANKYKFDVEWYFHNKRTDVLLHELFSNSQLYGKQLRNYVDKLPSEESQEQSTQVSINTLDKGENTISIQSKDVSSLLYIQVRIDKVYTLALIDTGAVKSTISQKFFQSLRSTHQVQECDTEFSLANGQGFVPDGMVKLPLTINDVTINTKCIIVNKVQYNVLLGMDFISAVQGGIMNKHFVYTHPQTKLLQSTHLNDIKLNGNQSCITSNQVCSLMEAQSNSERNIIKCQEQSSDSNLYVLNSGNVLGNRFVSREKWNRNVIERKPLTRRQKFHNKLPPHLKTQVKELQDKKASMVFKSSFLYPNFPLKKKYQLILVDPPIRYESQKSLKPPYPVLSMDDLKRLPIKDIGDEKGCVLLQWASGITIDKVMDISKSYGFKHYTFFKVWRKLNQKGELYSSKTLNAITTLPNYEFLVMSVKGDWKKVLREEKSRIYQEVEAKVASHSIKPSEIYTSIKAIFEVEKYECLEVFANIQKHPYLDLYGNNVQNFFQPSLKVIHNNAFINDVGEIQLLQGNVSQNVSQEQGLQLLVDNLLKKSSLQKEDRQKVRELIFKSRQAFALNEYEVGEIQDMEFPIDLIPGAQPFAQQPYRLSDKEKKIMKEQIENWEKLGYIQRKNTEWASPAFLVPKGDDQYRVCTDYRYLNVLTLQHHWPIPNMFDFFPYLSNKPYVSKFDLKSSYQNMRIRAKDQDYTTFICFLGTFICLRMLFGQKNSASYFQMAIESILKPLLHVCVLVYIDDIIVFSNSKQQHLKDLESVLQLLIKGNVKLHANKSSLFLNQVEFLGHTIKDGKYYPRPKKYGVLKDLRSPQNKSQLKSFLGLVGFYRKFVQNFAIISKPLNDLLKQNVPYSWEEQHERAFQQLRNKVMELPALHLPNTSKTFFLSTDFCIDGLGAVLSQKDDKNNEYPIEFASRGLNVHEKKYGSYEGELLAVIWALQKFRHLLINGQFVLYTDNKALSQVLQKGNPSLKLQRWLQILNEFSFLVIHRKSKNNVNADSISRLNPIIYQENENVTTEFLSNVNQQSFEPIDLPDLACKICKNKSSKDMLLCELCGRGYHSYCIQESPSDIPNEFYYCAQCYERIQKQEVKDIMLDFNVLNYVKSKVLPQDQNEKQRIIKRARNLVYDSKQKRFLIKIKDVYKIIPTIVERRQIIQQNHDNCSHPGTLRTCSLILQNYYWRNVVQWVKQHIMKCALCIANKSKYEKQAEYIPVEKGKCPGQYWAIDLATNLPTSKEGYKHLLVTVDSFSKWVNLIELKTKQSLEISLQIHKHIISTFGKPLAFRSDRGGEFKGNFDEFCKAIGISHHCTFPNHPRGNGQAERLVGFAIELIRRTIYQRQWSLNEWPRCIPTVLYTLRFSNCISKIPPFEVVFGRKPSLISPLEFEPKQVDFKITDKEVENYAKQLAISQQKLFPKIQQVLEELDDNRKTKYERQTPQEPSNFEKNQMVFRNTGQRTTKLQLSSQGPYIFIEYKGTTGAIIQDPITAKQYQVNKYDLVGIPKLTNDPMDLQPDLESEDEVINDRKEQSQPTSIKRATNKGKKGRQNNLIS